MMLRAMSRPMHYFVALAFLLSLSASCGDDATTGVPTPIDGEGNCQQSNRRPHIDPIGDQTVNEGELLRVRVTVSDPDDDTLYLESEGVPDDAVFDPVEGELLWQPSSTTASAEEGSVTTEVITISVDDNCLRDETSFTVTVNDVNRSPFFLAADASQIDHLEVLIDPDTEEHVRFQVVDPDNDDISLSLMGSPAYARLDGETLILSPTGADTGTAEFEIVADDGAATATLPVTVIVGNVAQDIPAPTGLGQSSPDGPIAVGDDVFEGRVTFVASPHAFTNGDLRLSVEIAEVGQDFSEGIRGTSELVPAGVQPIVDVDLDGGVAYRWRARFLSDEFGGGPYASFGGNADGDADMVVSIVPETTLDVVPHDPSPIDVVFEFSSENVSDFECQLDEAAWTDCTSPWAITVCPDGNHAFRVRGVTRDGVPDPSPAEYLWEVVDLLEPNTSFTVTPPASVGCSASFSFTSDQSGVAYECQLTFPGSGDLWVACDSPKVYEGLTSNSYTFSVRAVNIVDLVDRTPATHPFSAECAE